MKKDAKKSGFLGGVRERILENWEVYKEKIMGKIGRRMNKYKFVDLEVEFENELPISDEALLDVLQGKEPDAPCQVKAKCWCCQIEFSGCKCCTRRGPDLEKIEKEYQEKQLKANDKRKPLKSR